MTTLATMVVKLIGDIAGFTKSMQDAEKQAQTSAQKIGSSLQGFGGAAASTGDKLSLGVTLPLAAIGVAAIKSASDLGETSNKIQVLFGGMTDSVQDWSSTAATSLGQSRKQALDAAADFAVFGKAAGLAGTDLVGFAKSNTQLAADMASFFNTSPEEAIKAIGAEFRGESEPIRKYGVLINDAALKDEALRQGLIKTTTEALTPQARVLAAQALIMQQTSAAQGDFARTSTGLANQQRILKAEFEDTAAALGTSLLPIATQLIGVVRGLVDQFNALPQSTKDTIVQVGLVAAAIGPLLSIGGRLIGTLGSITSLLPQLISGLEASGSKFLAMGKSVVDVAGTLQRIGVTSYTARDALIRLKDSGALLTGELALLAAGLVIIGKYLEQVSAASQATNDELIEMSHSGDVFKQAGASTEILVNGANRIRGALDGVNQSLQGSATSYAQYISGVQGAAQAAGYQIDAAGNLTRTIAGLGGVTTQVVQANYALSQSQFDAANASHSAQYGIDLLSSSYLGATTSATAAATATQQSTEAVRAHVEQMLPDVAAMQQQQAVSIQAADAQRQYAAATVESATQTSNLAQSLAKATEEQAKQILASSALQAIADAYKNGAINQQQYNQAIEQVQIQYGLATEQSLAMSKAQTDLNAALASGKIPLDAYVASIDKIPTLAADGQISMSDFAALGLEPAQVSMGRAMQGADNLTTSMRSLIDIARNPIKIDVLLDWQAGSIPTIPATSPAARSNIPGAALGADFVVPSGFPNDTYPLMVSSGEHVTVEPRGGGGQGGNTSNVTINIGSVSKDYTPQQAGDEIIERLRSRGIVA
jgi:hypothetical protein